MNHALNFILKNQHSKKMRPYWLSLEYLTSKQWQKLKSSIVDSNNHLNSLFPSFNNLYKELSSGFQLVNNFSDHFSFHIENYKEKEIKDTYICNLDKIFKDSLLDPKTVTVIFDANIKNNIATLISYICFGQNTLAKIIYHAINVTFTEVELFAIRCDINQVVQVVNATHIIVITNAIHSAKHIFDLSSHSYQLQFIAILQDLRAFLNKNSNNSIAFWNCFSSAKWTYHLVVDKETK